MADVSEHQKSYKYDPVSPTEPEKKLVALEIDDATEGGSQAFLYIAACTGNLAAFTSGITLGWTSPVIPKLQSLNENPLESLITQSDAGWIGSLLPLGAVLGPFLAGAAADKIGRKSTLLAGNIPFVVGLLLNIIASNVYYLFLSRFLCGLSVGFTFTVLPMYVGEIAEDRNRSSLGTLLQLFCTFGLLFSYLIGPYLSVTHFNLACLTVPVTFLVTFYLFVPDSPYYLVQKSREDAQKALMKLRGATDTNHVNQELNIMQTTVHEALDNKSTFLDIFKSKGLTKAYVLSNGLMFFQQFSGINIVLFFTQTIFIDAGVSLAPELCTIVVGIVQVVSSGASSSLIETKGKRLLLMISAGGMAVSEAVLAYFFFLKDNRGSDVSGISWLPILCLIVYIITYCLGFGPIPWTVMGEMFPANVKSVASTFTAATCWFFGFLLTKYFATVADLIGKAGSFGLFAGCCAVGFAFVYKFLPETSGKSLQEIQDILNGKNDED
ncbi:facilitated trehalose transporter Tret1-like [Cylas formicarius]|uniref:facilitated trehalose transporter Tret1-like n=1 Tax=Cylas formicarius TaxID=197179 RepID=UPI002958DC17|nr:facilitated trehalose transporter Tret1-like [Cylas formicarius]